MVLASQQLAMRSGGESQSVSSLFVLQVKRSEVAPPGESAGVWLGMGQKRGTPWRFYYSLRENEYEEVWTKLRSVLIPFYPIRNRLCCS